MAERSLRAHGYEMSGQLHQYPGASTRVKSSFGLMVKVKIVSAAQEHEEVMCSRRNQSKKTSLVGILQL